MRSGECTEREITEPVDLCNADGTLDREAIGWSRSPLHRCNLPTDARRWGRAKRWDYWCVTADPWIVSFTIAHVDYLALVSVWFRDLDTGRYIERNAGSPFAVGLTVPDRVGGADIRFKQFGSSLALTEDGSGTRLQFHAPVKDGGAFDVDLLVASPPGHETLSVVIPWSDRLFQYTSKHNTRPTTGTVRVGDHSYEFGGDGNEAWGCLDYGRGRWPYRTAWNWGSASGRNDDGRVIGLQLGGKWTAGTGMTENALCIDGRLHKISEELTWEYGLGDVTTSRGLAPPADRPAARGLPIGGGDPNPTAASLAPRLSDRRSTSPRAPLPWAMSTPVSDRIDLRFEPQWNKSAALDVGVAATRANVCFGHFTGTVVADDGEHIDIGRLFGWAEDCRWKW